MTAPAKENDQVQLQTDPVQAGFDPERLRRIDRHFAEYVACLLYTSDAADE